jgi:hypothetical protein
MRNRLHIVLALCSVAVLSGAQALKPTSFSVDFSAAALAPITWGETSPALSHWGFDALAGLEFDTPLSIPLRLEAGYIQVGRSAYSSSGELYRAWDGLRLAVLTGYSFRPLRIISSYEVNISVLAGGALTAAEYSGTALAYAYPSVLLKPRAVLPIGKSLGDTGPYLELPIELMFRDGYYSLAYGLALGWRYRIMGAR